MGVDGWPVDEWSLHLTAEQHLAPSTIRGYQCTVRLFTEYLADSRYGWISENVLGKVAACLRDWRGRCGDCAACDLVPSAIPPT